LGGGQEGDWGVGKEKRKGELTGKGEEGGEKGKRRTPANV